MSLKGRNFPISIKIVFVSSLFSTSLFFPLLVKNSVVLHYKIQFCTGQQLEAYSEISGKIG